MLRHETQSWEQMILQADPRERSEHPVLMCRSRLFFFSFLLLTFQFSQSHPPWSGVSGDVRKGEHLMFSANLFSFLACWGWLFPVLPLQSLEGSWNFSVSLTWTSMSEWVMLFVPLNLNLDWIPSNFTQKIPVAFRNVGMVKLSLRIHWFTEVWLITFTPPLPPPPTTVQHWGIKYSSFCWASSRKEGFFLDALWQFREKETGYNTSAFLIRSCLSKHFENAGG